ncbi:MAG: hypothetical protein LC797_01735 [Chloroflexi bacterium]|nr:hypothetical protein [Chloroflexota bacterium]
MWSGTNQEAHDLLVAVLRHCTCVLEDDGRRDTTCPPHAMLFTDQRAINGLLFARHLRAQLRAEEFAPVKPTRAG